MILRRLAEYADRLDLPPEMYEEAGVAWIIELTADGELEGFVPLEDVRLTVPRFRKESEPRVLSDQAKHVLNLERGRKHSAFVELARRCYEKTEDERILAVVKFLEDLGQVEVPEELDGSSRVVFRVEGEIVTDLESVQRFWARYSVRDDAVEGTCLVTGKDGHVEKVLPGKIKGVRGTPGKGVALVSAKHDSTHHYSLDQSLNMPISRRTAERYTVALNSLLRDEERSVHMGEHKPGKGVSYVFWSKTPESRGEFYAMLVADAPEEVRDLLLSPVAKKAEPPRAFYMLTLTGTKGRVLVRDFMETTVGEVKKNVTRWFKAQRHLDAWGEEGKPLKIFPLVASCYADKKEIQPRTIMAMWNTALKDQPPPNELLIRAVSRCRVEGDKGHVTRPRAALLRVMLPYTAKGGEIMEETVAYQCGRLLAELKAIQEAAMGSSNVSTHFAMASTRPYTAFPMLLRYSQPHLSKVQRGDKPWLAPILQQRLEEIISQIRQEFPQTLSVREQGIFDLGHYQHRAAMRAERKEHAEAKRRQQEQEAS